MKDNGLKADKGKKQKIPRINNYGRGLGLRLHANAHKIKYMCFNKRGDISTLNGSSLKLVDKFTYLRSSVASTERDINKRLAKA